MSFFGRSAAPQPSQPQNDAQRKEAVMASIRQEVQGANAKELMENLTEKCYSKCVPKPGTSMSSSEETCVSRCMDLYFQAFNIVAKTYTTRLHKERVAMKEAEASSF